VINANLGDGPLGVVTQGLATRTVRITFLGFKCIGESTSNGGSDTDEPYFVVSVDTANGLPRTEKFGPYENIETGSEVEVGSFLAPPRYFPQSVVD